MRVAYDDGEEILHPLTERWRAEGRTAADALRRQLPLLRSDSIRGGERKARRQLPLLRSDCLSEQVEQGQQRSNCRSSEGSSQLRSHCGGCLCCAERLPV